MDLTPLMVALLTCCLYTPASTQDLVLRTSEEVVRGTYIGNVSDIQDMFKSVSPEELQTLKFGIINKASQPTNLFRIDSDSGKIYTEGRIDREALCDYTDSCRVEFDVAVHSTSTVFSNVATVHLYIDDINDNSPTFPANEVTLNVSEIASVGAELQISGAVDRDSLANNTIQSYRLSTHRELFNLTTTKNYDGSAVINLLLMKVLDHEELKKYMFNIVAVDGGSPPRSGVLAVTINVIDENDNPPRFLNSTYSVLVREDAALNNTVLVVAAVDPDLGKNGRIRYQFSNLQSSKMQSLFSIDSVSGEIRVAGSLEYDERPHQLIVEAQDGGDPPLKTQTVITVTVLDSGNNRPVVKVNTLTAGGTVPESAGIGYFVAVVDVEDSDTGNNGHVICNLSTVSFSLEPLSGRNRYKVLVNRQLDHESKSMYNISVNCQDKGSPPLFSTVVFQMRVTDVNDNDPHFERDEYTVSIRENSAIGYSVLSLSAIDADSGENAQLKYFVAQNSPNPSFRIQHETGIITTNRKFDRESEPVVPFVVLVIDQGIPARTGTARVTLHVTDVNDNFPVFTHQLFQFRVLENRHASSVVGHITALDKDAGRNGEVEYFIAESPDGITPFKVLANGTVITTKTLDREAQSKYIFTVLARDKGSPPKTNSSEVSISVLDENDNIPSILFPTTYNHTVYISRPPEKNSVIGKIVAYDGDQGENSSLSFTLTAGDVDGAFAIDKESGETMVAATERLENKRVYDLTITVQDSGNPPLVTDTHLIVVVEFDNETSVLGPQKSDKYVVIAAVVASATVILSIIIIAAICFVLRSDSHKSYQHSAHGATNFNCHALPVKMQQASNAGTKAVPRGPEGGQLQSGIGRAAETGGQQFNRKKEVSFTLHDSLNSPRDLTFTNSKLAFLHDQEKILHLDDLQSDTSGETIPSDSGRGGSEEEVHVTTSSKSSVSGWQQPREARVTLTFDKCVSATTAPGIPRHVRAGPQNQIQFLHTNSLLEKRDIPPTASANSSPRDCVLLHGHTPLYDRTRDFTRPLSFVRQTSTMSSHEDDASTTTSGSYTINQDDFSLEDRILGTDVIV